MRFTNGLGLMIWLLLACSGGVLEIGGKPVDSGESGAPAPGPDATAFSAAAVARARTLCAPIAVGNTVTSYPQAALQRQLVGGWLMCHFQADQDRRSFQFTSDRRWYTLVDDGNGGLVRGSVLPDPEYDGVVIGQEGTYSFQDAKGAPSGADGPAVFVATHDVPWFHPEFTGPLMTMSFSDASRNDCVIVEP